jgi:hypothetical protein
LPVFKIQHGTAFLLALEIFYILKPSTMIEPLSHLTTPVIDKEQAATASLPPDKLLVEYAPENPLRVIREVFQSESLDNLKAGCLDWFHVALVSESTLTEEAQRQALWQIYEALQPLLEALFLLQERYGMGKDTELTAIVPKVEWLSRELVANPMRVVSMFCKQFSPEYTRQQLWDWLVAGIGYGSAYPETLNESMLLILYDYVLCLTASAFALTKSEFDLSD